MQGLASGYVHLLVKLRFASFANLNVVTPRPQVHVFSLVRRTGKRPVDKHLGVLHLRVQLDLT